MFEHLTVVIVCQASERVDTSVQCGMTVILKSPDEIEHLRAAGRLVAQTYEHIEPHIQPGVQTLDLDRRAEDFIRSRGARPMYKGYAPPGHQPFPATICVAINDVVVHGFPRRGQ